jgi:hypothetical protein
MLTELCPNYFIASVYTEGWAKSGVISINEESKTRERNIVYEEIEYA